MRKILFIDDDPGVLKAAELLLRTAGYAFKAALSPAEAYSFLAVESFDAIFLDLNFSKAQMTGAEGLACLKEIRRHDPDVAVLVVTGHSGLSVAVQALRAGAQDFIMKPWNNERLLQALEDSIMASQQNALRPKIPATDDADFGLIVGECDALVRIKALVARYAPLTASILLIGAHGTGKSLLAHSLHRQSNRSDIRVIEAASLSEADLTDLANATIVLENIDQLDARLAPAVTAWLQVAARRNTRLVATCCQRPSSAALPKSFLYAISTLEMNLPALGDRGHDLGLLANHFARTFALEQGFAPCSVSNDAIGVLKAASLTDNLHALRRVIERAVVSSANEVLTAADIDLSSVDMGQAPDVGLNLEHTEKFVVMEALNRHNFNITKAANELGLTRQALYRRMARHGI